MRDRALLVWVFAVLLAACESEVADEAGGAGVAASAGVGAASGAGGGGAAAMGPDAGGATPAAGASGAQADAGATPAGSAQDGGGSPATPDAAATPDAGQGTGTDAATPPAPDAAIPPNTVPMFVAQGHVGRTMISCDDGQTWVANRSLETEGDAYVCGLTDPVTCFTDGFPCRYWRDGSCQMSGASCDCDHHPGSGTGLAYGGGWFVGVWGWGAPGSVRRSRDGVSWEVVQMDTSFGGAAYGQGSFVLGKRTPSVSSDDGASWSDGGDADLQSPGGETIWNVRALGFVDTHGGRFVMAGEDADKRDVLLSSDAGESWWRPTTLPPECAAGTRGIVGNATTIVLVHRDGTVCYSTDGGDSFAVSSTGGNVESRAVWTGERFMAWGRGTAYASPDGESWTASATTPANLDIGAVAHSPETGTFVAIRGGWQTWYADQEVYRSSDGVTWSVLPKSAIDASDAEAHPVGHLAFGRASPSAACPLP